MKKVQMVFLKSFFWPTLCMESSLNLLNQTSKIEMLNSFKCDQFLPLELIK
jgi:hypothetical protein